MSFNTQEVEPRSKEEIVKQFREESLTDAARKIIAQEGFARVTIERVAEQAGVSKGTIYLYFKNKDDLIRATILSTFEKLIAQVRESAEHAAGFEARLRAIVTTQLQMFASHQAFFRSLLADPQYGPHSAKCVDAQEDKIVGCHMEYGRFVASILEEGKQSGQVRRSVDSYEVALNLIYILQATGMRHLMGLSPAPLGAADEVERLLDFVCNGIGSHGE